MTRTLALRSTEHADPTIIRAVKSVKCEQHHQIISLHRVLEGSAAVRSSERTGNALREALTLAVKRQRSTAVYSAGNVRKYTRVVAVLFLSKSPLLFCLISDVK